MGSLSDVLRLKDSALLREEVLNGRKAWVIQSEPKKDATTGSPQDALLLCYRNLLWIDQHDLALVKQEFSVLREYNEPTPQSGAARPLKPGSLLRVIYSKVNDSDWFPSVSFFYLRRRYPAGTISFGDDRLVSEETYTNYKKYDVKTAITFDPDQQ